MSAKIEVEEKLYDALKKRAKAKKITIVEYVSFLVAASGKVGG